VKYAREILIAVLTAVALPAIGHAQEETDDGFGKKWEGRVIVNVNAGLQTLSPSFAYEHIDNFIVGEMSGVLDVPGTDGPVFDVTAGLRLFGNFGIGVTYARYKADQLADLTATIQMGGEEALSDQIQVGDFSRTEKTVHVQAMYVIPFTRRVQLAVYGGPSYFRTEQKVLNDYHFEEYGTWDWDSGWTPEGVFTLYPESGFFQTDSASDWGYNVGADLNYFFSRNIGVGFNARYSEGSINYENPIDRHEIAHGFRDEALLQVVPLDMGGLQLVGGVRFRF
jgi:hypothetical protein